MVRAATRNSFPLLAASCLMACIAVLPALGQPLQRAVQRAVESADIGKARVGIIVREIGAPSPIAAIDPDGQYIPASNMKLLSSGAALAVLGPDFTFRTELALEGNTVIIRGSGDPALGDPEVLRNSEPSMTVDDLLDRLAQAIADRRPEGIDAIVTDDRVFDREFIHPTWDRDDLNKWYAPEVAGINFHGNLLAVFAQPARAGAGEPPRLAIQPESSWIGITNRAETVSRGANTYWASRSPDANEFRIFGDVRTTSSRPMNTPTHNNPLLMGRLLAERLIDEGVPVGGKTFAGLTPPDSIRVVALDETLPEGQLAAVVTTPLQEALNRCNTDSINLYAEALLKRIGRQVTREPGSWTNGASVLRMTIEERLDADAAVATVIHDGSGLSHSNLVTPRVLVDWIESFATDDELREPFLLSLATPGRGTFRTRFRDISFQGQLAGKSGVLTGVRTLSGIIIAPDGREYAFAVLANDVPGDKGPNATRLANQIAQAIDEFAAENAAAPQFGG